MSPRDIYGLAARLGGLVFWVFAAFDLVHGLASYFHVPIPGKYRSGDCSNARSGRSDWLGLPICQFRRPFLILPSNWESRVVHRGMTPELTV